MADRFDVCIVGAGAAGLTAALYAARRGLSTVVVSQDIGGQAATTSTVENYPGIDLVDGLALMMQFKTQAEKYGARVILDEVTSIVNDTDDFLVTSANGSYRSAAVILAQGLTHKHLNVPGEEGFIGKGVSYCATCDAPLFKGKDVVVVGGGNAAMDAALLLAKFCPQVTIVTINPEFRGEQVLIDRMKASPAIRPITGGAVTAINGNEIPTGVVIHVDQRDETIAASGIFVEIGFTVRPDLIANLLPLDGQNQIVIDPLTNGTDVPGLFAAGDVTTVRQKQIIISAGEGAKAALSADQYLQAIGRKPKTGAIDWGISTPHHFQNPTVPSVPHQIT